MATTILHFHLIISLLFFIFFSSSRIIIISCFARPTQEGQVPSSSVTPKAAAVHYWHLKTHSNKPLSPIFLSKLSPLSPSKFITTNDETIRAMISNGDNKVKMGKIDAPQDRHPTASDEGENPLLYHKYSQDRHPTASDGGENPLLYHKYAQDRHPTASDEGSLDGENPLLYHKYAHDRHPTASDEGENPLLYHKYSQDRHPTASDGGENLLLHYKYAHDRHPTASGEGENVLFYHKYNTPDHHATVDDDAKIATKHYNVDSNNNIKMVTGDEVKEKAAKQISPGPRGMFFRESELKEGKIIPSIKFAGRGSGQYFLSRSIASKIPFSATAISKIFQIPTDSTLYRAMKRTIGDCRMPPNIGETKQCITSAEDMIDYALSTLGANADIQFWSTHNSSEFGGKSLIGKVKVVYDSELTAKQHLTCHQVTFPYLVYHCHSVSKTRIYDIEILNAETKENINQGAVVCHLDTTGWDPNHKSFAALASAPGMTEVCHWIPPWDMALTACDGAAAATIVAE